MGRRVVPNPRSAVKGSGGERARRRGRLRAACACAVTLILGACHSGPKNFANENDTLREQVLDLQQQVGALQAELAEAKVKLAEQQRTMSATGEAPAPGVLEALPRCAGIEIDRLSGPITRDAEPGYPEAIEVYVRPYDGRQRFVQVAGTLTVEARYLPAAVANGSDDASLEARVQGGAGTGPSGGGRDGAAAVLLGSRTLDPAQLREAYRSGFMGTHYVVRITPPANVRVLDGAIVLSAVLLDGVSGRRFEAWRVVRVD